MFIEELCDEISQGEHSDTEPIGSCQIRQKDIGNCWIPCRRNPIGFYRTSEIMGILWILGETIRSTSRIVFLGCFKSPEMPR